MVKHSQHPATQTEQRIPTREHKRPSYLQDYVYCSTTPEDVKFCCSTITNLCAPTSNGVVEFAAFTSSQHIQEPGSYTEASSDPS